MALFRSGEGLLPGLPGWFAIPLLPAFAPWHYTKEMPPGHLANMKRYRRELADRLEQVALDALAKAQSLAQEGAIEAAKVAEAITRFEIDPERTEPWKV